MKTLIIGEVVEGKLSSGALEIIAKSKELGLEFEVATVGTVDSPNIGSDSFKNTYLKCNSHFDSTAAFFLTSVGATWCMVFWEFLNSAIIWSVVTICNKC